MLEGTGAFAEGLLRRGIDWQSPGVSTIQYLADCGVLETKPLLAHCINVDDSDIELIKKYDAAIAHCPKSNAKLGHGRAPFTRFIDAGVKVGFGSDSVASNNNCDILEEARFATLLARVSEALPSGRATKTSIRQESTAEPRENLVSSDALTDGRASDMITARDALFAATLGGARALGLDNQIGALSQGMQADLIAVDLSGAHQQPLRDPADALIFSSSGRDVRLTMVAGKEVYRDGSVNAADEDQLRSGLDMVRTKPDSAIS